MLAQMQGAYLMDSHLQGANLTAVNLQGAKMRRAHMQETDVTGGQLKERIWRMFIFKGSPL